LPNSKGPLNPGGVAPAPKASGRRPDPRCFPIQPQRAAFVWRRGTQAFRFFWGGPGLAARQFGTGPGGQWMGGRTVGENRGAFHRTILKGPPGGPDFRGASFEPGLAPAAACLAPV